MQYFYLEPEQQLLVEKGQDRERIAELSARALRAELKIAEAAHESQRQESQAIMLRLRAAHGIQPEESAYLEKLENGRIRWVVSRSEVHVVDITGQSLNSLND